MKQYAKIELRMKRMKIKLPKNIINIYIYCFSNRIIMNLLIYNIAINSQYRFKYESEVTDRDEILKMTNDRRPSVFVRPTQNTHTPDYQCFNLKYI